MQLRELQPVRAPEILVLASRASTIVRDLMENRSVGYGLLTPTPLTTMFTFRAQVAVIVGKLTSSA